MLKLHFAPNSRAGRIVWLLEELGLPYDINKMAFHPKDLKSDAHRARHPLGRVPVLDDGDVSIFESGAIIEYVLERHKNGGLKPDVSASKVVTPGARKIKSSNSVTNRLTKDLLGDARILFMSGYAERDIAQQLDDNRQVAFMSKPFTVKQLAERVKAEFSAKSASGGA
ncbi:MAG: glutathione S-transferase [Henriciella sp.]